MPSPDSLWYKDAVFYELHVKAFQDSNGDGVGDFRGLMERLDYVQELGVDCIWLLPFYPSPLRDDGYDIADYRGVNPSYGSVEDFQSFLDEAHRRGLRVIADLVLNHTSDQHPWFQRARRAPRGSPARDFYVWSDRDDYYRDARIIFTDTEPSNWTWDPVAGQYYWHRFFRHQPDLNWDNPEVKRKMFEVMEFWLERGLDGFRADAVPYLIEREGTGCENLPETHAILKEFRARMDVRYPDRILLAEANQWPDDVRPYFGDGDEFHMAFHFPLMPRIFMAVRQGVRTPIVDIIERTPSIPDGCQWCMFLRNHDELTLEMVTDEERDYLYREYAADPRMRINLGIRRRLSPLMDNDRRRIELLNSMLFTMPGSPIIYYGDEIGMGDNIWLGDRDGVRTPMQWTPDRNGGFSRAEAPQLYLPSLNDSVYGFQAINVEAQTRSPFSLLSWMKRLIQVRKEHRAFGRGTIEFLSPENPHVLAYLREYEEDVILVVNNLSGSAQAVQLDLSRFDGRVPLELLGRTEFLPIGDLPYAFTLSPYGFFWFILRPLPVIRRRDEETLRSLTREWAARDEAILTDEESVAALIAGLSPEWICEQRWFRGKAREILKIELVDRGVLTPDPGPRVLLALVRVRYRRDGSELYFIPLVLRPPISGDTEVAPIGTVATRFGEIEMYEALQYRYPVQAVVRALRDERVLPGIRGEFRCRRVATVPVDIEGAPDVEPVSAEQSNTSLVIGDNYLFKIFRRLDRGRNPDLEVSQFLLENTDFRALPALAGWVDYEAGQDFHASVAGLFEFIPNSGDAWSYALKNLERFLAAARRSAADPWSIPGQEALRRMAGGFFASTEGLGELTGRLHLALASASADYPDFAPEPITADQAARWVTASQRDMLRTLDEVAKRIDVLPGAFPSDAILDLTELVRNVPNFRDRIEDLQLLVGAGALKIRIHGDYHLGQVLRRANGQPGDEWVVLDFEGEPVRTLEERRGKFSPLRDVAGMLRSFDYAVRTALPDQRAHELLVQTTLQNWAEAWTEVVRGRFIDAYRRTVAGSSLVPEDLTVFQRVLSAFELEKAVYELGYEMNNRPGWIWIPVQGIHAIMEKVA